MWMRRQKTGSVLCPSCGLLVGVNDEKCYNCGRLRPGMFGLSQFLRSFGKDQGFVPFVIGTCIIVYGLTLLASGGAAFGGGSLFSLGGPSNRAAFNFGASGAVPVFLYSRWWTVLSASWLHAGLLHILFNMMAVRQLAPAVADMYGAARMVIIYVAAGVAGFVLSSVAGAFFPALPFLRGGQFTLGASASVSGLIGAILYYGHRSGSSMASNYATQTALMLVLYGFFMPGIDNYAHAGGFAGGYLAGRVLDPLIPERGDHTVIALVCLAASLLSILASVLTAL
jgi:rhomboid protease GluP